MNSKSDTDTTHHETVDDLRRDLMKASAMWQKRADDQMPVIEKATTATDEEKIAFAASLMAANYSYILAAVLGIAQRQAPESFARYPAVEVDEILNNGDFDHHNADVAPIEPENPIN